MINNDIISRQAVRDLICRNNDKYGYSDRFHEFTKECLKLPSVSTEKTGRWIKRYSSTLNRVIYECSECSKQVMTLNIDAYDYCHGCGCRMEVEE